MSEPKLYNCLAVWASRQNPPVTLYQIMKASGLTRTTIYKFSSREFIPSGPALQQLLQGCSKLVGRTVQPGEVLHMGEELPDSSDDWKHIAMKQSEALLALEGAIASLVKYAASLKQWRQSSEAESLPEFNPAEQPTDIYSEEE